MKKIVKLQESDISRLVNKILSEQKTERYMFFSNLEQLHRQTAILLDLGQDAVEGILDHGHDWAQDHVAVAKENTKFDVYPSAYANGYAVQVCKGRMPGLDGKKHCSGSYC